MTEADFLATLSATPDDEATLLVYADWLDDQGDTARPAFLRLQAQVRQMNRRTGAFRARCRRLRGMGVNLDPRWVTLVSRPSRGLAGRPRPAPGRGRTCFATWPAGN